MHALIQTVSDLRFGPGSDGLEREVRHQADTLDIISVAQTQSDAIEFVSQDFGWVLEAQCKSPLDFTGDIFRAVFALFKTRVIQVPVIEQVIGKYKASAKQ